MPFSLEKPLVSVVVINFNYGQFIAEAIQSLKDQSYERFECLIVDNNSSDDSVAIVTREIISDSRFKLQRLEQNLGHLGGMLFVLDQLKGDFVTFLDADDVLLPNFLVSHIQVHLSTAFSTGFTSSNAIEVNAEAAQVSSGNGMVYAAWRDGSPSLRPLAQVTRLAGVSRSDYLHLDDATRYVGALVRGWNWSPGSANMFRRALLDRLRPHVPAGSPLFGGVDGYYMPMMHAISGSNIINLPLLAYRIHGRNDYTGMASIVGGRIGTERGIAQGFQIQNLILITMIERCERLPIYRAAFWQSFTTVANLNHLYEPCREPEVVAAITDQYNILMQYFGERVLIRELYQLLSFKNLLPITLLSRTGWQKVRAGCYLLRAGLRFNLRRIFFLARTIVIRLIGRRTSSPA